MKILIAADESDCALRAVTYLVKNIANYGTKPEIHLLNVQPPLPGRATAAVSRSAVQGFYRETSQKALARGRRVLTRSRIAHEEVHLVGDPGRVIAAYATEGKFSLVIMGSHGQGAISSVLVGSVVRKVIAYCKVPLLIIR
jgi:nucleotide-binding universal stress UspA family protein